MSNITRTRPAGRRRRPRRRRRARLPRAFAQATPTYTPEEGASLRLLRWVPFVKGEEEAWNANTKAFTDATGVEVRIDKESWEDVRPKAAVAANVGSGPDMVMSWFDDPFQYPDKLIDVTELAEAIGAANGGWYDGPKGYAMRDGKFIAMPLCAIGNAICYRDSHMKAAGFSEFPKDTRRLPRALQGDEGQGHARRLPARQGGRRRQQLRPLAALEPRRQDDRRGRHGRHRQPRDPGGDRVRQGALRDLHPRHRELARHQQQPRLPRRAGVADRQRRLALLRGDEGPGAGRDRRGHPHHQPADRPGRQVGRAAPDHLDLDLQPHASTRRRRMAYLAFMYDAGADERLDHGRQRLLLRRAQGLRQQPGLDLEPDPRALCQGLGDAAAERLCRPARLCLGRRDGRLRAGRHVRRGGHRPGLDRRRDRRARRSAPTATTR